MNIQVSIYRGVPAVEKMNREMKGMLFSVLHIPPLPVMVHKTDSEDHSLVVGEATESSHSLLGNMLDWCAMAQDYSANIERMQSQIRCLASFRVELESLDKECCLRTCPIQKIYDFYCKHTREWFRCYNKHLANQLYTRPCDYVIVGDSVHKNMCDYTKAQFYHMSHGESSVQVDERISYGELLRRCALLRLEAGVDSCSWVGGSCWATDEGYGSDYGLCDDGDGGYGAGDSVCYGGDAAAGGVCDDGDGAAGVGRTQGGAPDSANGETAPNGASGAASDAAVPDDASNADTVNNDTVNNYADSVNNDAYVPYDDLEEEALMMPLLNEAAAAADARTTASAAEVV